MASDDIFEGDNNHLLYKVQYEDYYKFLWCLLKASVNNWADNYKHAWDRPEYVKKLKEFQPFDHRVLGVAYFFISSAYRYLFCPHENVNEHPRDFELEQYYMKSWREFYKMESNCLANIDEASIAIMECVAFENTDRGYAAEDDLGKYLLRRYPFLKNIYDT